MSGARSLARIYNIYSSSWFEVKQNKSHVLKHGTSAKAFYEWVTYQYVDKQRENQETKKTIYLKGTDMQIYMHAHRHSRARSFTIVCLSRWKSILESMIFYIDCKTYEMVQCNGWGRKWMAVGYWLNRLSSVHLGSERLHCEVISLNQNTWYAKYLREDLQMIHRLNNRLDHVWLRTHTHCVSKVPSPIIIRHQFKLSS